MHSYLCVYHFYTGRPELAVSENPNAFRDEIKANARGSNNNNGVNKSDGYKNLLNSQTTSDGSEAVEDGLEDVESEITKLRWSHDQRVFEVRKLLQSARPVIIGVQQRPEVSDHDFVEEQERSLQSLCIRTMALPVGRGAMTFQTASPLPTEPITIPRLCLSGKAPPRGKNDS